MGWLQTLIGKGTGSLVEKAGDLFVRASEAHLGKKEFQLELAKMADAEAERVHSEIAAEISAKQAVMVAELQSGDNYTRRARPSIVYVGLAMFVLDVIARYVSYFTGHPVPETQVPQQFWYVWGSVSGAYVLGRSIWDKRGTPVSNSGIPRKSSILE